MWFASGRRKRINWRRSQMKMNQGDMWVMIHKYNRKTLCLLLVAWPKCRIKRSMQCKFIRLPPIIFMTRPMVGFLLRLICSGEAMVWTNHTQMTWFRWWQHKHMLWLGDDTVMIDLRTKLNLPGIYTTICVTFNVSVLCAHLSMRSNSCKPEPLRANISETVGQVSEQDKKKQFSKERYFRITNIQEFFFRSNSHILHLVVSVWPCPLGLFAFMGVSSGHWTEIISSFSESLVTKQKLFLEICCF